MIEGDPLRVAIQVSASDLPSENAWCDFDADLLAANLCGAGASLTRDIVQTEDCNVCHGPTSETRLSFHGGGRTDVEYCVTCHNPTGNTDMTLLILDNGTVAMTGGQPTALPGERLTSVVLGLGADPAHVHRVEAHPRRVDELSELIRAEIAHPGLSVVIVARECIVSQRARKRS